MTKAAPISEIVFDLTLPKKDEGTSDFQPVYWNTEMPQGGLAVNTRDVTTLVNTLATGVKMRVKSEVRFGDTYDKGEGVPVNARKLLQMQLLALAKRQPPRQDGERGEQDM